MYLHIHSGKQKRIRLFPISQDSFFFIQIHGFSSTDVSRTLRLEHPGMWMFSLLNYTHSFSYTFFFVRLHHLGHQKGDFNSEFFLVKKNAIKCYNINNQDKINNYIWKQLSNCYSLSRQNKSFVNNDPKGPVLSVKRN